ncbi:hypothetical protein SteCoe_31869 [Stentor coeruleus]|uniref:EF-hand domain-containing protein n=1 Tax=Stentor coeruleus TaxID=5963 RepID=A0A1R2B095_9CILI|nr:hypothetical protein SteCoe_31869 [Stentor coeruleus]
MEAEKNARILVITIDISDHKKGNIIVHENDDAERLSDDFIKKYCLDKTMKNPLMNVITAHQDIFRKQKQAFHKKQQSQGSLDNKILSNITSAQPQKDPINPKSPLKKSSTCTKINYGEVLYEKGLKMKENQRQLSEKRLQEKESEAKKNLTFKPKINQKSKSIVKSWERDKKLEKNRQYIIKLHSDKQEELQKECYFVPQISQKSSRTNTKNIFSSLYKDACSRRNSQEAILNTKEVYKKSQTRRNSECTEEFFDRLYNSKKKTDEETEKLRKQIKGDFDKDTGQKFFTPVTGRKPNNGRGERPIWDELYSMHSTIKEKIEEKKNQESEKFYTQASESSCKLYENFKSHKFEALFRKLDSDRDGMISLDFIDLDAIDTQAAIILTPILEDLDKKQGKMGLEEFMNKIDVLYTKITPQDRMVLIKNDTQHVKEFTFTPVINEKSKKIAAGCLKEGTSVYERNFVAGEIKNLKIKKNLKVQEMMKNTSY